MRQVWLLLPFLLLAACDSEVEVKYEVKEPVKMELYSEGYFATVDLEGTERMGTITATYLDIEFSQKGDTLGYTRHYQIDKSRGYLKNYMPSELVWRIGSVSLKALDRKVLSVEGLDKYDSLLKAIPMPTRWRDQLLNPEYADHLLRAEKHRWEMTHILAGKLPSKANVTELLRGAGRLNFALISIDSVVTEGFENLDHRHCLAYSVYLRERESFPYYIWEQHVNSNIVPKEFQKYNKGLSAEYETRYRVALDPETGILCQEHEFKQGVHTMVNAETGDTATFRSNVSHERLYTFPEAS